MVVSSEVKLLLLGLPALITIALAVIANHDFWKPLAKMPEGPDVAFLLLGKTGNGRSSLGNNIIGRNVFETGISPEPLTMRNQLERVVIGQRHVEVMDTPGLYIDNNLRETNETIHMLENAFKRRTNGYHAFLIVLKSNGRISNEDVDILKFLEIIFGGRYLDHVIFVFTHMDVLRDHCREMDVDLDTTFRSYLDNLPVDVKNFISKANNRYLLVDSTDVSQHRNRIFHKRLIATVDEIIVDEIMADPGQKYETYNYDDFKIAQYKFQENLRAKLKEEERKRMARVNEIRKKAFAECKSIEAERWRAREEEIREELAECQYTEREMKRLEREMRRINAEYDERSERHHNHHYTFRMNGKDIFSRLMEWTVNTALGGISFIAGFLSSNVRLLN